VLATPRAQTGGRSARIRVHAVCEKNDIGLARGIEPHRGTRKSLCGRKKSAPRGRPRGRGIGGINVPAESALRGTQRLLLRRRHFVNCCSRENAPSVGSHAAGENHAAVNSKVIRGGEEPSVPRYAAIWRARGS